MNPTIYSTITIATNYGTVVFENTTIAAVRAEMDELVADENEPISRWVFVGEGLVY